MSVSPSLKALGGILGAVMLLSIKEIEKEKRYLISVIINEKCKTYTIATHANYRARN